MPRTTEHAMLACFPAGRRPPSSSHDEGLTPAGTGSMPSPAFLDDDRSLYPDDAEPEADAARLSNAIASRRFFLASPGMSNSIVDSAERAASHPCGQPAGVSANNVRKLRVAATAALPAASATTAAFSPAAKPRRPSFRLRSDDMQPVWVTSAAPRADFLESMAEMADALDLDPRRGPADVACLQELLLCYIAANEHNALKNIIGAYADLLRVFGGNAIDTADGEI